MADSSSSPPPIEPKSAAVGSSPVQAAPNAAPKAAEGNPALRMMGLPRIRARLPSRNWLIFFALTGSFASAVYYDKYQTKRAKAKWCGLVSHISEEIPPPGAMPRKVTVYLAAPPGDGIRSAREHFHEYVKPILVAGAMDWDVVEGRREGDVRWGTAERIRKERKRKGESTTEPLEMNTKEALLEARERAGLHEWQGVKGDIIIGRHTWKEYVRGLHEGWLGPIDPPAEPVVEAAPADFESLAPETAQHTPGHPSLGDTAVKAAADLTIPSTTNPTSSPSDASTPLRSDDASPTASSDLPPTQTEAKPAEEPPKPPKPRRPPPYISASTYSSATPAAGMPTDLGPAAVLPFPHVLGFLNTPTRVGRFLNRRHLADDIGRRTAAAVLASYQSFQEAALFDSSFASESASESTESDGSTARAALGRQDTVQNAVLAHEERDWEKALRKDRKAGEESVWLDPMILDQRIAERMRVFRLDPAEEERAMKIERGEVERAEVVEQ
ncbi:mitochondrial import inner membrane translocase subunit tim54 [Elasticomyces elasticus]|nr:mitochondrial import inner membrane translocase subunit tim54 [Elasticomyces elasticus]